MFMWSSSSLNLRRSPAQEHFMHPESLTMWCFDKTLVYHLFHRQTSKSHKTEASHILDYTTNRMTRQQDMFCISFDWKPCSVSHLPSSHAVYHDTRFFFLPTEKVLCNSMNLHWAGFTTNLPLCTLLSNLFHTN